MLKNQSLKYMCTNICWKTLTFEVSEQGSDAKLRGKDVVYRFYTTENNKQV